MARVFTPVKLFHLLFPSWPASLLPQVKTLPLLVRAMKKFLPTATSMAYSSASMPPSRSQWEALSSVKDFRSLRRSLITSISSSV